MGYTDAPPGWWREFIMASPARTAKLAVVRADGSPHVAPVWADVDGDQVVFMTSADTVKGQAILRDPRVSLCWDDERPPFSFVTIAGIAATTADTSELLRWATRIGGRYMGAGRAEEFGRLDYPATVGQAECGPAAPVMAPHCGPRKRARTIGRQGLPRLVGVPGDLEQV